MKSSVQRLRWFLLTGAALLVVVLVGYIGYGRFKALMVYRNLIKHAGVTISHDTNGFTYSQTEQGRTIFTLHAAKATQLGEGQWALHDVAVTLYGRQQERADHVTGAEFTYNEKEGVVQALGEVHIDLEAPQSLTTAGRASVGAATSSQQPVAKASTEVHDESANVIHVRTSGLRYLRKLGVAATDQPVEFHYGGIECTALGAEFDSSESTLRLLANVVADGVMHNEPLHVTAASADVDRNQNIVTLTHTVAATQQRKGVADSTVLHLRKDGSVESARARGHVVLTGGTQQVTAPALDAVLNEQTLPQTARLSGGVTLLDSNAQRPLHGSADHVDIAFDAQGSPSRVTGGGAAQAPAMLSILDKRVVARGLQRNLQGSAITATFAASPQHHRNSVHLVEVHAAGAAQARSEALYVPARPQPVRTTEPQIKTTSIAGDDLRLTFSTGADERPQPQHLIATGHTLLRQDAPQGEQETSAGDALEGTFSNAEVQGREQLTLVSAVQTGHVVVHRVAAIKPGVNGAAPATQQVANATADRATYDGTGQKLTLSGNAHLTQDNATVTAASVVLDQRTQDADAVGSVQATLENASAGTPSRAPEFTHVLASSAHFAHDLRQAEFRGTDTQPARMWQEASQVQAAVLVLDDLRRTFSAHGAAPGVLIHAVLAGAPKQGTARSNIVRVASVKMDYSDTLHQAVFSSGPQAGDRVQIDGTSGTIHAQRATAYLTPADKSGTSRPVSASPFGGSLDRIVIAGDVQLDQPGRHGAGEQLVYTAATGESVLTGRPANPPHITDAQQGSLTGTTLLFGDSGSTIVVSGEKMPAQPNQPKPARVHTETHLQSGSTERQ